MLINSVGSILIWTVWNNLGWAAWIKSLLRHEKNNNHGPHLHGAQWPLWSHVPVTQNIHVRMHKVSVSSPRGPMVWDFGARSFTPHCCTATFPTSRAPCRQRRQVPKPADWWGQQNHSLKQKIVRGGKTSWVSASAHKHQAQQGSHLRGGQGAPLHGPSRNELPASSPGLLALPFYWKAWLREPYPLWTGLKPQQEHKISLPHFPLLFQETEMMPISKVCLPRDLRSSDATRMLKPRTAECYLYRFCTSCPMRSFWEGRRKNYQILLLKKTGKA